MSSLHRKELRGPIRGALRNDALLFGICGAVSSYKRVYDPLHFFLVPCKQNTYNGTITNSRKHQTAQLGFATVESTSFSMSCHNNCVRAIKQEMYNSGAKQDYSYLAFFFQAIFSSVKQILCRYLILSCWVALFCIITTWATFVVNSNESFIIIAWRLRSWRRTPLCLRLPSPAKLTSSWK